MSSAPVISHGDNTQLELYNYSGHTQPQPSNNFKMSYSLIPDIFVWSTDFGAEKKCSKHRTLETGAPYNFLAVTVQNIPASSPVARNHFFPGGGAGMVFELINKESGGEGSDGKGEKTKAIHDLTSFPLSLLLFPITPLSRSALIPIILCSRISLVSNTPR